MNSKNNYSEQYFAWKIVNIIFHYLLYRYASICTTWVGTLPSVLWSNGNCMEFGHSLVWYGVWRYSLWNGWTNMVRKLFKYFWTMLKMKFEFWPISKIQYPFFSSNANITFRTRVSADCRDLIQSLLKRSPSSRIPLEKILNHRWVTSTATPCGPLSPNGTPNEGIPPRGPPPQRSLVHARASLIGDFSDLAPLTGEFCFLLRKYYDFVPWVKTLHQLLVHLTDKNILDESY